LVASPLNQAALWTSARRVAHVEKDDREIVHSVYGLGYKYEW